MNKYIYFSLLLVIAAFVSCGSNEPKIYTSIQNSTWRCEETNSLGERTVYVVDISRKISDTTLYVLSNFYNVDVDEFVFAKLNKDTLTISPSQQIGIEQQLIVKSGSGLVSSDFKRIIFNYKIFNGQSDIDVHAIYSR